MNTFPNIDGDDFVLYTNTSGSLTEIRVERIITKKHAIRFVFSLAFSIASFCLFLKGSFFCGSISMTIALLSLLGLLADVKTETVTWIDGFGFQVTTKFFYGRMSNQFVKCHSIAGLRVNEVLIVNRIIYLLQLIVEDPTTKIIPLFQYSKPRLKTLTEIYTILNKALEHK